MVLDSFGQMGSLDLYFFPQKMWRKKINFGGFWDQDCEKFDRNVEKCRQLFIKAVSSQARLIATKAVQGSPHIYVL